MDLGLEKKIAVLWWSKVTESNKWYKLQYEDQDYVWDIDLGDFHVWLFIENISGWVFKKHNNAPSGAIFPM